MGVEWAPNLADLLQQSDYVSLHCPLTDETRKMMGAEQFAMMKSTAIFINMARGGVVEQPALYEALNNKTIARAAIDVTDPEPIPMSDPLLTLDNVVITPHVGSASEATFKNMGLMAVRNITAALTGGAPETPVNPEALQNR